MQVYAPIAHRLGMSAIKSELEDISFSILHPEDFNSIKKDTEKITEERQEHINLRIKEIREALEKEGLTFAEADVQMVPQTYISLDAEASRKMGLLIENLEDLDDVIEVYHNWEE